MYNQNQFGGYGGPNPMSGPSFGGYGGANPMGGSSFGEYGYGMGFNGGGFAPPPQKEPRINKILIPITIIMGILSWLLCIFIYNNTIYFMPRPVLVGLLFGLFCFILSFTVFIVSKITNVFEHNIFTKKNGTGSVIVLMLIGTLLVTGLGMLFQFLYQLDSKIDYSDPTSYIFVIDDSGSMDTNDPNEERILAIDAVLEEKDDSFPYMVYSFANEVSICREMAEKSITSELTLPDVGSGTAIKYALETVINDYTAGKWDGGAAPKLIFLTDGKAGDISRASELDPILEMYSDNHISISTIGLGASFAIDEKLMTIIASQTGGNYIHISDASDLSMGMKAASIKMANRDLFSSRYMPKWNVLYGFLRVLFVAILGILIGFTVTIAYGLSDATGLMMISSVIKSLLGAIILEVGICVIGFPSSIMWLILWILIACTIAIKIIVLQNQQRYGMADAIGVHF